MSEKLKIFLSYHKATPLYKSDVFQPLTVGKCSIEGVPSDNSGDNISHLNPYYCELTGQYWVLKNYLKTCEEEYVGFAHYRRLPDLLRISDVDEPSVFGIDYSASLELFNELNSSDLYSCVSRYDVIVPCTNYMYEKTVNPVLKQGVKNYNVYDHFYSEHHNNLLDILKEVLGASQVLSECYAAEKSLFYNIYIMKKELLISYLEWMFSVLSKVGERIGGWEQDKYLRMAGFVSETLTNVWIKNHPELKVGYVPLYMVDFESEYIAKANEYHSLGKYGEEINVLRELLKITSDKYMVASAIAGLSGIKDDLIASVQYAKSGDDYYNLALIAQNIDAGLTSEFYEKAVSLSGNKDFALQYLGFADGIHNLELSKKAWDVLLKFDLTPDEQAKYKKFLKIYEIVNHI